MLGIGAARPKRLVSNAEVCEILDSSDEWIFERSGIRNRRYVSGDESVRTWPPPPPNVPLPTLTSTRKRSVR